MSLLNKFLSVNLEIHGCTMVKRSSPNDRCVRTSCVTTFAIVLSVYGFLNVDGALLGLALVYSLSIVTNLNGLVSSFAETEQAMISVERIVNYINLESENDGYDGKLMVSIMMSIMMSMVISVMLRLRVL